MLFPITPPEVLQTVCLLDAGRADISENFRNESTTDPFSSLVLFVCTIITIFGPNMEDRNTTMVIYTMIARRIDFICGGERLYPVRNMAAEKIATNVDVKMLVVSLKLCGYI